MDGTCLVLNFTCGTRVVAICYLPRKNRRISCIVHHFAEAHPEFLIDILLYKIPDCSSSIPKEYIPVCYADCCMLSTKHSDDVDQEDSDADCWVGPIPTGPRPTALGPHMRQLLRREEGNEQNAAKLGPQLSSCCCATLHGCGAIRWPLILAIRFIKKGRWF